VNGEEPLAPFRQLRSELGQTRWQVRRFNLPESRTVQDEWEDQEETWELRKVADLLCLLALSESPKQM
jgi:hypothetical protein